MAAIKIQRFLGEAPKISPELLPDSAAQLAFNTKLYSGDLIPYRIPTITTESGLTGVPVKTLFGLRAPNNGEVEWLVWDKDVDIVTTAENEEAGVDNRTRFYYTGDGAPKVSDFDLATSGPKPYPVDYYDLGLPLPTTKPTTTAASFSTLTTASFARDAGNTATITTASAHGLRTGNIVTVSAFTGDPGTSFNVTNTEITATGATTITYFSPGDAVSTTANTSGRVALAGNTFPRSYVFTWITPWGEESIPSDPSDDLYIKEGQIVTVTGLPTEGPTGKNFVRGVRIYRTIVTTSGTDFFRIRTLWFPTELAKVSRASNVSTVTLEYPHNFIVGDRFKISGCTDTSFNITDGIVTEIVNRDAFKFAQTASDVAEKDETAGTLFHDVSELLDDPARYWGDANFNFIDDFNARNLFTLLASDDFDAPPANLRGLTAIQNNILAGFVGNQLFFSEPSRQHAWPKRYALTFDSIIVGIAAVSGFVVVLTETYPYRVSGSDPEIMAYARIDTLYPCLSKRSIVNMGYGVAYSTHGGIAIYAPTQGADLVTKFVHDWDTWTELLDPASIVATFHNGKYFASHSTDALIFERDDKIGGFFVRSRYRFDGVWVDPITNQLFYTIGNEGLIFEWDSPQQPLAALDWKSKVITNQEYINVGAARIIADYAVPDAETQAIAEFNTQVPIFNAQVFQDYLTLSQTASIARTSNVATIVTAVSHRLLTGSTVTVSGFTSGAGITFNATEVEVTVVNATTFTYDSVGTNVSTTADTSGTVVSLKGLGTVAGPFDAVGTGGFRFANSGTLNSTMINGDNLLRSTLPIAGSLPVTFRLWANKELVFQATIFDDSIFRLPAGYRADTFEVAVSGSARIRAIHLGETPYGLRAV